MTSIARKTTAMILAASVILAGCSSTATHRKHPSPAAAMRQVAGAATSAQFCALASRGFATFLGGGRRSACAARLPQVLSPLPHGSLRITHIRRYRSEYIVNAVVSPAFPDPTDFYFVRQSGIWRLHSIGIYKAPDAGPDD